MLTKLFVSGKNWKLSLAELTAYLNTRQTYMKIKFFSKEFFVFEIRCPDDCRIDDLGGTIKIGDAKAEFSTLKVRQAFLKNNKQAQQQIAESLTSNSIAEGMARASERILFGVSVYCSDPSLLPKSKVIQRFVGSTVKKELLSYGRKSKFMGFSRDRKLPQLSQVEVLKKNMVEKKAEVLLCIGKEDTWVGITAAVHNPFEFQKRDIYKPNQRKIFAMPPRLARIMVNLSLCTSGKVLLDPFCGVGTILQEALLARAKIIGVDANSWCVKAANENLEWLTREYNLKEPEFRVVQGEAIRLAQKIGQEMVDCIATEPDLGPALRQVPTIPYAQKIIKKLEPMFFGFVEQAYRVLKKNGRIVLVTPYITTRSRQAVTMPIDDKLKQLGFNQVPLFNNEMFSKGNTGIETLLSTSSLIEIDEHHKVGREIHVYEK